ncbi:MAG: DUF1638 domain-containing protein [Clostridiales bacterium]|nr:DUF1638 domain-containing protein [Clostridiales bacterium]
MRIHIIACRIFNRELSYLASQSENQVDITWVGRGLHNTPEKLCARLKNAADSVYDQIESGELESKPDYIVLGYGLCSRAVVGVRCRGIPIVIPRTDDCIAVFLGSQERYMKEFSEGGGAYWLNSGWIEQSPKLFDSENLKRRRWLEYAEKFGEDNADYLIEVESSWEKNYDTICYVHSDIYDSPAHYGTAKKEAEKKEWRLKELKGDNRLLKMMVDGDWNEEEFLVLKPGERIDADYSGLKLKAVRDDG